MNREQIYDSFYNGLIDLDDIIDISQKDGYNQALADERAKTIDELETKLQCWDKGANAIPNYAWKCIRDMKGGAE